MIHYTPVNPELQSPPSDGTWCGPTPLSTPHIIIRGPPSSPLLSDALFDWHFRFGLVFHLVQQHRVAAHAENLVAVRIFQPKRGYFRLPQLPGLGLVLGLEYVERVVHQPHFQHAIFMGRGGLRGIIFSIVLFVGRGGLRGNRKKRVALKS